MAMITINILGKPFKSLAKEVAKIVSLNGVEYLGFDEKFISISIRFSGKYDYWYNNLRELDEVTQPTFFVHTTVPANKLDYSEVGGFIINVRNQISDAFSSTYSDFDQGIPDRNNVIVSVMPD